MNERIGQELALLRGCYPDLEHVVEGHWVRFPSYRVPPRLWNLEWIEVCFQIPAALPGQAPYGFYARPELRLADGARPNNYEYPVGTPFGEGWGKFSWQLQPWAPAAEPSSGTNLVNFAQSFVDRLREGK